jgi:hypothetical protein
MYNISTPHAYVNVKYFALQLPDGHKPILLGTYVKQNVLMFSDVKLAVHIY